MPATLRPFLMLGLLLVAGMGWTATLLTELRPQDEQALRARMKRLQSRCPLEGLVLKGTQPPREFYLCMEKVECRSSELRYKYARELRHPVLEAARGYVSAYLDKGNALASQLESARRNQAPPAGAPVENLFDRAIQRNQLVEFAVGQGEYFVYDQDYGTCGGHWVLGSWDRFIFPSCTQRKDCAEQVSAMLTGLMRSKQVPLDTKLETVLYHLQVAHGSKDRIAPEVLAALKQVEPAFAVRVPEFRRLMKAAHETKDLENFESMLKTVKERGGLVGYDL